MQIFNRATPLQKEITQLKRMGKKIGFVPTMGALHKGHMSLINESIQSCDITIVSIFVNPTQFSPNEDFDAYPRPSDADQAILEALNVDYLFMPSVSEMYPTDLSLTTQVIVPKLSFQYCAETRPAIFTGATTVVCRLLNICQADIAYFGEKDFQQFVIIQQMAEDLFIPTKIKACPIIREKNGLAMSSRNQYFSSEEREEASIIYHAMQLALSLFKKKLVLARDLKTAMEEYIKNNSSIRIAYIAIIDSESLKEVETVESENRILFAGYLNKVRLIDNIKIQ